VDHRVHILDNVELGGNRPFTMRTIIEAVLVEIGES